MPLADLGDVTIHYEEAGSGPMAFVHCHGLGQNGDGFIPELPYWAGHFGRAITWDNRGLGRSSTARKYSLPLYALDIARLLDCLGITKAVVHGVSWGGVLAQQFAIDHLDKCAAVIIDSSSSEVNLAASERWYAIGESAKQGQAFSRAVKPEHVESFVASARAVAALREHPLTPRLKSVTCPVLVIAGAKDEVTAGTIGSSIIAKNLPNAELVILPDAGHAVYNHAPAQFRDIILAFCRKYGVID